MEMDKREWNRYSQARNNYWFDVELQIERWPYAHKISEIFLMVFVSIF